MLELIDQTQPQRLIYRCVACHVQGVSSPQMTIGTPGFSEAQDVFWVATPGAAKPGKWVRHECDPARVREVQAELEAIAHAVAMDVAQKEQAKRAMNGSADGLQAENARLRAELEALRSVPAKPKRQYTRAKVDAAPK